MASRGVNEQGWLVKEFANVQKHSSKLTKAFKSLINKEFPLSSSAVNKVSHCTREFILRLCCQLSEKVVTRRFHKVSDFWKISTEKLNSWRWRHLTLRNAPAMFSSNFTKINRYPRTFFYLSIRRFSACFAFFVGKLEQLELSQWNSRSNLRSNFLKFLVSERRERNFSFFAVLLPDKLPRIKTSLWHASGEKFYETQRTERRHSISIVFVALLLAVHLNLYGSSFTIQSTKSRRWFLRRPSSFFVVFPP